MLRASSAHLQEDTVVHMQLMVLSLSMRVRGGLSVHSLSENWLEGEGCWWVSYFYLNVMGIFLYTFSF